MLTEVLEHKGNIMEGVMEYWSTINSMSHSEMLESLESEASS